MSRIGKQSIIIPDGIEVNINNNLILVKGPKGELSREIHPDINIEIKDKEISVRLKDSKEENTPIWGTYRALIANMIMGVSKGFEKRLIFEGVGFRAVVNENKLVLSLGFSHPVEITASNGVEFKVEKNTIIISGADKNLVGQIAANIRATKKPEPYKGKGIRYEDEVIRRKAGKKAATGTTAA
ncbi:MAG: 50S ribosomal protein L6 [Candidatus Portnoybacteria bacterium RBG_13_40_8]|uniref:Large ribosomal subunit protein uL6 n=1 Tax=Candidatus Portnoybacteria bacterium RBG_13_40_8 TaxID=1801990 RepID=A0A1G2F4C5_9BACT|nr:MAG: 50S ribosomal protein L6 [Candidatus Portnoybacteria bacterium RBG_13_40_8]